jgi:hypothetical protein
MRARKLAALHRVVGMRPVVEVRGADTAGCDLHDDVVRTQGRELDAIDLETPETAERGCPDHRPSSL